MIKKNLLLLVLCCLLVSSVSATSLNFQSASHNASLRVITQNNPWSTAVSWTESGTGGNSYETVTDAGDWSFTGFRLASPSLTTYAAATTRGGYIPDGRLGPYVALYDQNLNKITGYGWNGGTNGRWEMKMVGGTAYYFYNGVKLYNSTPLSVNPSFVSFGSTSLTAPVGTGTSTISLYWDDYVYGETENKYVLGLPETDNEEYIIMKDLTNPSASGLAFGNNGTVVNSNYMVGTWSRGNSSVNPDTQPNETIQFINYVTGEVIQTNYTGTDYTGTCTYNIKQLLIDAGKPMGYYAMYMPDHKIYSNVIVYKSNGASVHFNKPKYSKGDEGTVIYYVMGGGYWDTSQYAYQISILSRFGQWMQNSSLTASSGTVTYGWKETDSEGVYYAILVATDGTGKQYILGQDACELMSTFQTYGFVNNGPNQTVVPGAVMNLSQGAITSNITSGFDGNYSSETVFGPGGQLFYNVTAPGYQPYQYSFSPAASKSLYINVTLSPNRPLCPTCGVGIGGVVRDTTYGRPVQGALVEEVNNTLGVHSSQATSMTGWYFCHPGTSCYLVANNPYLVTGSKLRFTNATYSVFAAGVLS